MYSVYQEGIYLDYRYYETRYEDAVMGTGNAGDYNWSTTVAFPFGYGDSYTTFEYSDLDITPRVITPNESATVRLKVTNTGKRAGDEVVQLYIRDVLSSITTYEKNLAASSASTSNRAKPRNYPSPSTASTWSFWTPT